MLLLSQHDAALKTYFIYKSSACDYEDYVCCFALETLMLLLRIQRDLEAPFASCMHVGMKTVFTHLSGLSLDVVVEVAVDELDRDQGAAGEDHVVAVGDVVAQALCQVPHDVASARFNAQKEKNTQA
jgi:hypothetical protein